MSQEKEKKHSFIKVSKNIAIVIGKEFLGEDSFFHRIVKGVEFSAISKKFNPIIMSVSENDNVDAFISKIVDLKPSGVVVVRQLDGELEKRFKNLNFPMVFIDFGRINRLKIHAEPSARHKGGHTHLPPGNQY